MRVSKIEDVVVVIGCPYLRGLVFEPQKEPLLNSRRTSNSISPLTANPLNAKDGAVWQVAKDIFEDLGGVESSLLRHIDSHGVSGMTWGGVEGDFDLLR